MMINVEFNGGQGRKIYAEMEIPEDANPDEYGYDELKDEIIAQAKENDIDTSLLKFWWD